MRNCSRCLLSSSFLSSLTLDENLICQFCKIHEEMEKEYPRKLQKSNEIYNIAEKIKNEGRNKKHNCIVGVSGGRDSSYLLYFLKKKLNLNPLAVHYDNGFDSDDSVSNIYKFAIL